MDELETIRDLAGQLAEKGRAGNISELTAALDKVSQAFQSIHEVEKTQAEIRKLAADEEKLRYDLEHLARQQALETRKQYATIFAPVVTTGVLGLTLILQAYQFIQSERDKREASEDAQWSEAVKAVSQSGKVSPIAVVLNPFLKSKRYAEPARMTAVQVLVNTHDTSLFADLFREAFVPVSWANLSAVLQLDRSLGPRLSSLYEKTYVPGAQADGTSKLDDAEKSEYDYIRSVIKDVSVAVAPLLKGPRPAEKALDLRSAWFTECDWSGVDLSGADLENADVRYVVLKGADLGRITSFDRLFVYGTAWWDAKRISPELLDYLETKSRYDPAISYGPRYEPVSPSYYRDSITRLRAAK